MRASTGFRLASLAAMVVVGAIWFHERTTAAELTNRLAALHRQAGKLPGLQAEREQLREQLATAGSIAEEAPAATGNSEAHRAEAPVESTVFVMGEWTPATAWQNEGRSTPLATMATLLWAAAGGDLATLKTALLFNDEARAKALALFDTLPPVTRSLYATPEDFVASATIKNIPLTTAQLSWFHQTDADQAIIGVQLAARESRVEASAPSLEPAAVGAPPILVDQNRNRLTVLTLRRLSDGWRVVVPATAIDRIASELRAPPAE